MIEMYDKEMIDYLYDRYILNDPEYDAVLVENPIEFDPRKYGINSSGNPLIGWNGHSCVFVIRSDGIYLTRFTVKAWDDVYPVIEGNYGRKFRDKHRYDDLSIKLNYTGHILVGGHLIERFKIDSEYQRAWAYEELHELIYVNNTLLEVNNYSNAASELREALEINPNGIYAVYEKDFAIKCKRNLPEFYFQHFYNNTGHISLEKDEEVPPELRGITIYRPL